MACPWQNLQCEKSTAESKVHNTGSFPTLSSTAAASQPSDKHTAKQHRSGRGTGYLASKQARPPKRQSINQSTNRLSTKQASQSQRLVRRLDRGGSRFMVLGGRGGRVHAGAATNFFGIKAVPIFRPWPWFSRPKWRPALSGAVSRLVSVGCLWCL